MSARPKRPTRAQIRAAVAAVERAHAALGEVIGLLRGVACLVDGETRLSLAERHRLVAILRVIHALYPNQRFLVGDLIVRARREGVELAKVLGDLTRVGLGNLLGKGADVTTIDGSVEGFRILRDGCLHHSQRWLIEALDSNQRAPDAIQSASNMRPCPPQGGLCRLMKRKNCRNSTTRSRRLPMPSTSR